MVGGHAILCVEVAPRGILIFRRSINIVVKNIEESVSISITGVTSSLTLISGILSSLACLTRA